MLSQTNKLQRCRPTHKIMNKDNKMVAARPWLQSKTPLGDTVHNFLMRGYERSTPTSYLWLVVAIALIRTISEVLRFS